VTKQSSRQGGGRRSGKEERKLKKRSASLHNRWGLLAHQQRIGIENEREGSSNRNKKETISALRKNALKPGKRGLRREKKKFDAPMAGKTRESKERGGKKKESRRTKRGWNSIISVKPQHGKKTRGRRPQASKRKGLSR